MLKASDVATLADSIIELLSQTFLIGKMMKEKVQLVSLMLNLTK